MEMFRREPRMMIRETLDIGPSPEDGDDQLWRVTLEERDRTEKVTVRTFRADWRSRDDVDVQFAEVIARMPPDRPVIDQVADRTEPLGHLGGRYFNLRFEDD